MKSPHLPLRRAAASLAILAALAPTSARAQDAKNQNTRPPGAGISLGTEDVTLPPGYVIEPVLTGMTFTGSMCFGDDGSLYIAEAGHCYGQFWTEDPRIFRYQPETGRVTTVAQGFQAPIMGITFRDGKLYVAHRGTISTVDLKTRDAHAQHRVQDMVTGLPVVPNGQHFNSPVAFGPDGKMYHAVGTFANTGVPDESDAIYGWLLDLPGLRDAPAQDVTLTGDTYPSLDVLGPTTQALRIVPGSAFQPFGTTAKAGQVVPAHPLPTGAIFRFNPDGTGRELVAWGIRSPVGFAYGPDGQLYLTDHGIDDKGARAVANSPDSLWRVRQGAWYGWPDFTAGLPLTDPQFRPKFPISAPPRFVMQNHPPVEQPAARFEPHASAMKFDWSRSDRFGFRGEMFLAEFGDGQPLTTGLQKIERKGFRVVRVSTENGQIEPFLTINNPGLEGTRGPKRPYAPLFDPSGENLYLLDFGLLAIKVSPREVGIDAPIRTGTLWRIRRVSPDAPAPTARPVARVEGSRYASWWTSRGAILVMQRDIRAAVLHAERARMHDATSLFRQPHREQARDLLRVVAGLANVARSRITEDTVDDGTGFLLDSLAAWAKSVEPLELMSNDPMLQKVNAWIERTQFPDAAYLRASYSAPGRWQRPLSRDIRP